MVYFESRLGIYYEHPDWFGRSSRSSTGAACRTTPCTRTTHQFDPSEAASPYSLVFNRMSPSAYLRGRGQLTFYTLQYLAHLERLGVRVVNGSEAWRTEISKAYQLTLLERARPAVSDGPRHPSLVAGARGGRRAALPGRRQAEHRRQRRGHRPLRHARRRSSARPRRASSSASITRRWCRNTCAGRAGRIVRVEVLDGKYLYAIRVYTAGDSFNLCPADVCQTSTAPSWTAPRARSTRRRTGSASRPTPPPDEIVEAVERIMAASGIEIGGIEYMIDARDGRPYFYDINALSNFVADAPRVLGFDPFARLADWLQASSCERSRRGGVVMRFGYWLPVFGGWLRNVDDEEAWRRRGTT